MIPTENRTKSRNDQVCAIVSDTDRQRKKERESIEMVGCHSEICLEYIMKWTSEIVANRTWAFRSRDVRRAQKGNDATTKKSNFHMMVRYKQTQNGTN